MAILLAFSPFVAFAVLNSAVGTPVALAVGAGISAALILRDRLRGASPKLLEVGSFLLFAAVALYSWLVVGTLSVLHAKLLVDIGLLAIVLASLLLGRPFTLDYAKEEVAPEHWDSPVVLRTNQVITLAWAATFAVIVLAQAALVYWPDMPHRMGIGIVIAALLAAVKFTRWYPTRVRGAAA